MPKRRRVFTLLQHSCCKLIWKIIAFGLLLAPASAFAQQSIKGVVAQLETVTLVDGATVLLLGTDGTIYGAAITDSAGRFEIGVPTQGDYVIRAQRVGYYGTESGAIEVPENSVVDVRVNLKIDPVMLEALNVYGEIPRTPELQEFHRRRAQNRGINLTLSDFERENIDRLRDVLSEVPLARVRGNTPRRYMLTLNHRLCSPPIFVDGRQVRMSFLSLSDVLPMSQVYGVEVYPTWSDIPSHFSAPRWGDAKCGVILIWTMTTRQ